MRSCCCSCHRGVEKDAFYRDKYYGKFRDVPLVKTEMSVSALARKVVDVIMEHYFYDPHSIGHYLNKVYDTYPNKYEEIMDIVMTVLRNKRYLENELSNLEYLSLLYKVGMATVNGMVHRELSIFERGLLELVAPMAAVIFGDDKLITLSPKKMQIIDQWMA